MTTELPPPGWYPDPTGKPGQMYWVAQTLSAAATADYTYHGTGNESLDVNGSTLTARCRIQGAHWIIRLAQLRQRGASSRRRPVSGMRTMSSSAAALRIRRVVRDVLGWLRHLAIPSVTCPATDPYCAFIARRRRRPGKNRA
jgi:hypothetical protein